MTQSPPQENAERKSEPPRRRPSRKVALLVLGVVAVVFHRPLLGLLAGIFGNLMPVFFTPGLLELSLGVIGFSVVLFINYLLRRERHDEWVEMEVGEDDVDAPPS